MSPTGGSWPKIPQARMRSLTENVIHGNPDNSSAKTHAGTEGLGFEKKTTAIDPDRVDVLYGLGQSFKEKVSDVLLNDEKKDVLWAKVKDRKEELKERTPEEMPELDKSIKHIIKTHEAVDVEEEESMQTYSKAKGKKRRRGLMSTGWSTSRGNR
jgi:hypothetical protein